MRAARIGPTVCELLGPMPILKRSKTETAMGWYSGLRMQMLVEAEAPRAVPERERGAGPQRGDAAVACLVPAGAAAGGPDRALHALLQLGVVGVGDFGLGVDRRELCALHAVESVQHIAQLRLDHEDHRVVAEP